MALPSTLVELAKQKGTQFNYLLPGGDVLPASINPSEAATIDLRLGVVGAGNEDLSQGFKEVKDYAISLGASTERGKGGGVLGRNEPAGAEIASRFQGMNVVEPTPNMKNPNADLFTGLTAPKGTDERMQQLLEIGRKAKLIGEQIPAALASEKAPVPPVPPVPGTSPITSVSSLYQNQAIVDLENKIKDQSAEIKAGMASGGATKILEGLFEKFGVAKETSLLNEFNATILEQQQRLRKIPDDIKNTLQNVGVTDSQLNRLILKETQKPMEVLRDLMEQRGAAQDRVNQSLKFVNLFEDAELKDQAAKIEAMKFDFETDKDLLSRLDKRQQEFIRVAMDEKKDVLSLVNDMSKNGAPESVRADALKLTREQIVSKYGNYLVKPDTSPSVIGSADKGYFQYDPTTGNWNSISGTGTGAGTTLNQDWFTKNYTPEQLKQSAKDYYLALPADQLTKLVREAGVAGIFTSRSTEVDKYLEKLGTQGYVDSVMKSIDLWRQAGKTDAEILEIILKAKK